MRVLLALVFCAAFAAPASAVCVGDCGGNDEVAVNELVIGVGLALGGGSVDACPSFDMNGDGEVAIGELVTAVNNLLMGCQSVATPTGSRPATATRTATPSPTITPTPAVGPDILFFGMTLADDTYQAPSGTDANGIPIFERPFGFGFSLVVEARRGTAGSKVGHSAFTDGDPPDLQVQVTQPLGDGSPAVCDGAAPIFGGVPAINPPRLDDPDAIADALNDLGCRFIDGVGAPEGRTCSLGCVRFESGEFGCQTGDVPELLQFCAPVPMSLRFAAGDTLVSARVRDESGNLGAPKQLIVRVLP